MAQFCLTEYPMVANANATHKGWDGKYPAPDGAKVIFTCEFGFADGKKEHQATCSSSDDFWCTSFNVDVTCPKPVYPDCRKTEKGKEYMGRINKTETGKDCLRWDSKPYGKPNYFETNMLYEEHFLNEDPRSHENYCRNPALKEKPWCFVSDTDIQWEFCNIPFCEDRVPLECKLTQKGGEYMGKKNRTILGLPCIAWLKAPLTFQYRKWIQRKPAFSDDVNTEHNYCRNPGGRPGGPWCYNEGTSNQTPDWHYCDVPFCSLPKPESKRNAGNEAIYPNCRKTEKGKEYMGIINISETGKRCMRWDAFLNIETYPDIMVNHLPLTVDSKVLTFEYLFINSDPYQQFDYCRNTGSGERPWCFVSKEPSIEWEYCDIPFCDDLVPLECKLTIKGGEYVGKKNVTQSGKSCLPWLSRIPEDNRLDNFLFHLSDPIDSTHNFCRNPPAFIETPWCWTSSPGEDILFEECGIPFCYELLLESLSSNEGRHEYPQCRLTQLGTEYMGTVNRTMTGKECLPWNNVPYTPLPVYYTREWFPDYVVSQYIIPHKNYCRNPGLKEKPWCFVADPEIQWEYCDIPLCDDSTPAECKFSECGWEYAGSKNVTNLGVTCEQWSNVRGRQQDNYLYPGLPENKMETTHNFCRGKCSSRQLSPEQCVTVRHPVETQTLVFPD
ncbi:unnamed protein product [Darwinula stevensoni]|uniref:Kringle domain-containing protein n=1 Tax=Darwinula stevensoni TaxID=69355 RepID=A0A7R8XB56_9CRUS|nr:unnamed protein product [Darwinula stevensoni]CAG0886275.1 unnamed protein product [Darwinula stevensoni]